MTGTRLSDDQRRDWLRLARAETVGPVAFRYLIETYGEAAIAIGALPRLAERAGRAHPPRLPSPAEAQREIEAGAPIIGDMFNGGLGGGVKLPVRTISSTCAPSSVSYSSRLLATSSSLSRLSSISFLAVWNAPSTMRFTSMSMSCAVDSL